MTVIVLEGPEKSGKSTLAAELARRGARIRKWGPLDDEKWAADLAYSEVLAADTASPDIVVWDRSWASEAVYGALLNRDRRLAQDPWLGEWLYGRAVPTRIMLGGPDPAILRAARTPDDLPVDPGVEQAAFLAYARQYDWIVVHGRHPVESLADAVLAQHAADSVDWHPTTYAGRPRAGVVVLGERRSPTPSIPGGWLPFTSTYTTKYGRVLGPNAMRVGWTNAYDEPTAIIEHARVIIACGQQAHAWIKEELSYYAEFQTTTLIRVPSPSALYQRPHFRDLANVTERSLVDTVRTYLPSHGPRRLDLVTPAGS